MAKKASQKSIEIDIFEVPPELYKNSTIIGILL